MNVIEKMLTALRGGATEAGEAIVDSQALRILDQEIRDASQELNDAKASLVEIMAGQKLAEEKWSSISKMISEHEAYAVKALEKNDEALALEIAEKIADLGTQLEQEGALRDGYLASADSLRDAIKQTERNLKHMKQQVDTVKATDSVQRAQAAVAERHSGSHSKMRTAMESLERIKEKQAIKSAQMSSARELAAENTDVSLQAKLEAAGITSGRRDANEILQELKQKTQS